MNRIVFLFAFAFFFVVAGPAVAQIRANEALAITITGVPDIDRTDISQTYPVSEKGLINLPHIGILQAAGLDAMTLAKRIQDTYRKAEIFANPTVNVRVISDTRLDHKTVVVGGSVVHPGAVQYRKGLTLWQAIQAAGGDNPFGAIRRVELHREKTMQKFDLRKDASKRVLIEENDSIIVPPKRPFEGGW
jgi:polysaccharide export outer membrane protein